MCLKLDLIAIPSHRGLVIIDFSAKNFRSFKEEQRLSFVASNYDSDLPQNVIEPNLPGMDGVRLLKGIAIYRVDEGKLMERWVVSDLHGLLEEIGATARTS